jgi:hypothetical protein
MNEARLSEQSRASVIPASQPSSQLICVKNPTQNLAHNFTYFYNFITQITIEGTVARR